MKTESPQLMSEELVEFLKQPSSYPTSPDSVELRETHISWVFLTGAHAYKLKKPVRFEFLDFSSSERRKQACDAELTLNRRLAPSVYLDVLPVLQSANGQFELGQSTSPPEITVDWVVKMRQLDDLQTLEHKLSTVTDEDQIDAHTQRIAEHLARFYSAQAPVTVLTSEFRAGLLRHVHENRTALLELSTSQAESDNTELVHSYQLRFLATHQMAIDDRVRDGRVVDGHGDLRPDHVYLNHVPRVIDCIEFNAEYRRNDIADELAFLSMECDRLGAPHIGPKLFEEYARISGDTPGDDLVGFYKTYRACVRAKIAALQCKQRQECPTDSAHGLVRSYLQLASQYLKAMGPPLVIMVSGQMGTGKTTLARQIAEAVGGRVVSSDAVRQAAGPTRDGDAAYNVGPYSLEHRLEIYRRLMRIASNELRRTATVILDASFTTRGMRQLAEELAQDSTACLLQIECNCPREVAVSRIEERRGQTTNASEARSDLFDNQAAETEPPLQTVPLVRIDTTSAVTQQVRIALEHITALLQREGTL